MGRTRLSELQLGANILTPVTLEQYGISARGNHCSSHAHFRNKGKEAQAGDVCSSHK